MVAMGDDEPTMVRCRNPDCQQVVFRVTATGAVYPVGEQVRIERDGRLVVRCSACGERNRYVVAKKAA